MWAKLHNVWRVSVLQVIVGPRKISALRFFLKTFGPLSRRLLQNFWREKPKRVQLRQRSYVENKPCLRNWPQATSQSHVQLQLVAQNTASAISDASAANSRPGHCGTPWRWSRTIQKPHSSALQNLGTQTEVAALRQVCWEHAPRPTVDPERGWPTLEEEDETHHWLVEQSDVNRSWWLTSAVNTSELRLSFLKTTFIGGLRSCLHHNQEDNM